MVLVSLQFTWIVWLLFFTFLLVLLHRTDEKVVQNCYFKRVQKIFANLLQENFLNGAIVRGSGSNDLSPFRWIYLENLLFKKNIADISREMGVKEF